MANIDAPIGLWPLRHLSGGEVRAKLYRVKANVTIFKGDPVIADTTGTVDVGTATPGTQLLGVAAEYKVGNASGTTEILIYDDPMIEYGCQGDSTGAFAATDVFANAQFKTTHAGVAATGLSGYEIDQATIATTATHAVKILGLCESRTPGTEWGTHADLRVMLNVHVFKSVGTLGLA